MQLDEDAAVEEGEFDVVRIARSRLAQALRERIGEARQRVFALVMLVYGQPIEAGERLVDADEAQGRVAQSQADGNVPDGVQEAPSGVLFLGRGRHGRQQLALARRVRGSLRAGSGERPAASVG